MWVFCEWANKIEARKLVPQHLAPRVTCEQFLFGHTCEFEIWWHLWIVGFCNFPMSCHLHPSRLLVKGWPWSKWNVMKKGILLFFVIFLREGFYWICLFVTYSIVFNSKGSTLFLLVMSFIVDSVLSEIPTFSLYVGDGGSLLLFFFLLGPKNWGRKVEGASFLLPFPTFGQGWESNTTKAKSEWLRFWAKQRETELFLFPFSCLQPKVREIESFGHG